jgi:hypothetical protein
MSPAEIAARLSPAQRKALANPSAFGVDRRARAGLRSRKDPLLFAVRSSFGGWHEWAPTPLGLAVRAEIERMEKQDGE